MTIDGKRVALLTRQKVVAVTIDGKMVALLTGQRVVVLTKKMGQELH